MVVSQPARLRKRRPLTRKLGLLKRNSFVCSAKDCANFSVGPEILMPFFHTSTLICYKKNFIGAIQDTYGQWFTTRACIVQHLNHSFQSLYSADHWFHMMRMWHSLKFQPERALRNAFGICTPLRPRGPTVCKVCSIGTTDLRSALKSYSLCKIFSAMAVYWGLSTMPI